MTRQRHEEEEEMTGRGSTRIDADFLVARLRDPGTETVSTSKSRSALIRVDPRLVLSSPGSSQVRSVRTQRALSLVPLLLLLIFAATGCSAVSESPLQEELKHAREGARGAGSGTRVLVAPVRL